MSQNRNKAPAAAIGSAIILSIAAPFIIKLEGNELKAYQDIVGVWTICSGETKGVTPGMVKTQKECDAMTKSRLGEFLAEIQPMIKVPLKPETMAAHLSLAYNIGTYAYSQSSALRLTNAGQIYAGCEAMQSWVCVRAPAGRGDDAGQCRTANRDKRISNGLRNRRQAEIKLCLKGLE